MRNNVFILVYSEQEISPKAKDVIYSILEERFPDWTIHLSAAYKSSGGKVLVFGKVTDPTMFKPNQELVYTYSIAQIMSKANAATVLAAAIRRFIEEPEPIPFETPRHTINANDLVGFDYNKPIAIDIETNGDLGGEHTPEEVEIISLAVYQPGNTPLVVVGPTNPDLLSNPLGPHQLRWLKEVLPLFKKAIYHNGKFDIRVLERVLGVKLCNWFDTMLAHHVLNQAAGDHKLKHLARQYLGAPDWEAGISKYLKAGSHYELIPREKLVEYNGWDVYWTYKLYEFLAPQIEADEEAQKAFLLEMSAADFLLEVEKFGIPFDREYAAELGFQLRINQEWALLSMQERLGDDKFNPASHVQVKKALMNNFGLKGVPNTKEETIQAILDTQEDEIIRAFCTDLLAFRKAAKMYGTYVKGWSNAERKGRVHPTFLVHGTSTGRLSSTGPNAQNFPRDKSIRRLVALTNDDSRGDEENDDEI